MIKASYSAVLFDTAEFSVNEYGVIASSRVTKTIPVPALTFGKHHQNTFAMMSGLWYWWIVPGWVDHHQWESRQE
jgi:hypothetical protein